MAAKDAGDKAHAGKSQSAGRNTTEPGSPGIRLFYKPRSSDNGSDSLSVSTPYTEEGVVFCFRRGATSITSPVLTFPSLSALRSWKVRIGHALAGVAGYNGYREFGRFMEFESKNVDELKSDKSERRFGLLEAPLALSLYNTCPPSLQPTHYCNGNEICRCRGVCFTVGTTERAIDHRLLQNRKIKDVFYNVCGHVGVGMDG